MLQEGIQDGHGEFEDRLCACPLRVEILIFLFRKDNFTRFYILANRPSSPLPNTRSNEYGECNALIRLEVLQKADSEPQARDTRIVSVSDLLTALRLPALRIDRRPSISVPREQFGDVYLVEVMDDERRFDGFQPSSPPSWKEKVLGAITRVVESGGRATLLGTW